MKARKTLAQGVSRISRHKIIRTIAFSIQKGRPLVVDVGCGFLLLGELAQVKEVLGRKI
jgi:hypothetical protein